MTTRNNLNENYLLGSGTVSHQRINEKQANKYRNQTLEKPGQADMGQNNGVKNAKKSVWKSKGLPKH